MSKLANWTYHRIMNLFNDFISDTSSALSGEFSNVMLVWLIKRWKINCSTPFGGFILSNIECARIKLGMSNKRTIWWNILLQITNRPFVIPIDYFYLQSPQYLCNKMTQIGRMEHTKLVCSFVYSDRTHAMDINEMVFGRLSARFTSCTFFAQICSE